MIKLIVGAMAASFAFYYLDGLGAESGIEFSPTCLATNILMRVNFKSVTSSVFPFATQ